VHLTPSGRILAICDEELIGKVLKDKDKGIVIDLEKYKNFYFGEKRNEEEVEKILNGDFICINAIGEKSIKVLINNGLCNEKDIKRVEGVPMLQIFLLK
jgi:hypothetical protein